MKKGINMFGIIFPEILVNVSSFEVMNDKVTVLLYAYIYVTAYC